MHFLYKDKGRGLTDVLVPLWVQIGLVGETALHDVQTVVVTGLHGGHGLAVCAVHHLGQSSDTRWGAAHLVGRCENKGQLYIGHNIQGCSTHGN